VPVDFPVGPTAGTEYTDPVSGVTWLWDGEKWTFPPPAIMPYLPLTGGTLTGPGDLIVDGTLTQVGDAAFGDATFDDVTIAVQLNAGFATFTDPITLPLSGFTVPPTVTANGVTTIPLDDGEFQNVSLTGNASINITGWPVSGIFAKIVLTIINTGTFAITAWPAGTIWTGGTEPIITALANAKDMITLMSSDGGITIYGSIIGQDYF